jgi:glyoxylase-like metal-dependent hydrolase (beta-lactamase superfamily II)
MRIHAIQTGTVAIHERQRRGSGPGPLRVVNTMLDRRWTEPLPILAWAIEHPEGLIVVDTGETGRTSEPGYFPRWHPYTRFCVRMSVAPDQEIGPALERLGLSAADARWVVLTHMHTDHAGGLHHFPNSEILVTRREYADASGRGAKVRGYLPHRWPEWFKPTTVELPAKPFGPFERSMPLTEAGDVVLFATPGHTPGHMSVAVDTGELLVILAGDPSYTEQLMLEGAADGVTADVAADEKTLAQFQELVKQRRSVYLPTHDPESAGRLAAALNGSGGA